MTAEYLKPIYDLILSDMTGIVVGGLMLGFFVGLVSLTFGKES